MGKFLLFPLLWWIFGNPFIAILVLLVLLYALDRRFVGLSPSLLAPLKRRARIRRLRQELVLNPSNVSGKQELARVLLEKRGYAEARQLLEPLEAVLDGSAEYWDDLGTAYLRTGEEAKGEQAILRGLAINPRVKYGQPYLRLAAMHAKRSPDQAIAYLQAFRELHSSSCEAYYLLGQTYRLMGRQAEAKQAFAEALAIYNVLPKYKKRHERKWAIRSRFALMR